ncbi:MAG: hypothetical protein R3C45_16835 [Phycisphaerales bacterium]
MKRLNHALSAMLVIIGWALPVSAAVTITAIEVGGAAAWCSPAAVR